MLRPSVPELVCAVFRFLFKLQSQTEERTLVFHGWEVLNKQIIYRHVLTYCNVKLLILVRQDGNKRFGQKTVRKMVKFGS